MEGKQASDVAGRVTIKKVVIHAGKVGHLGEDIDKGSEICKWCGWEVEDVCLGVGFGNPGLEFVVAVEVR